MGPSFNNESATNESSSCQDTYESCRDPMVITEDGTPPDYADLWNTQEREKIACRLSKGFVCAKWTSYYEDSVEYTMHLCTKITVEDEGAMTSGCIESTLNNSRRTEVCACSSLPGMPCNSAPQPASLWGLLCVLPIALTLVT
ncbi:uncharacterized protein [Periplaneta americana]